MSPAAGPAPAPSPAVGYVGPALTINTRTRDGTPIPQPGGIWRRAHPWLVNGTVFAVAVALGTVSFGAALEPPVPSVELLVADMVVGTLGCAALRWRRRWPVGVGLLLAAINSFSDMASPAAFIALFTVAARCRWPAVLLVSAAHVAGLVVYQAVRPVPDLPPPWFYGIGVILLATVVAGGMYVRARRQLVLSLHERALRAETEQRLRAEQARHLERTRIAREMHDVLAHRLSLLSMHAGALEFRPDASPAEVARAAGVVRSSAHQALEDLREVIGILREAPDGPGADRPQPTLADLPALVAECEEAGLRVRAEYRVPHLTAAPAVTGRTVYRLVQEALTNVRKHAPGVVAAVRVTGAPGQGLTVEVRNPAPVGDPGQSTLPSAGTGLVGLVERVTLAGGHLEHGWTPENDFRLRAWLPWPKVSA